jgi:hypothetical protein
LTGEIARKVEEGKRQVSRQGPGRNLSSGGRWAAYGWLEAPRACADLHVSTRGRGSGQVPVFSFVVATAKPPLTFSCTMPSCFRTMRGLPLSNVEPITRRRNPAGHPLPGHRRTPLQYCAGGVLISLPQPITRVLAISAAPTMLLQPQLWRTEPSPLWTTACSKLSACDGERVAGREAPAAEHAKYLEVKCRTRDQSLRSSQSSEPPDPFRLQVPPLHRLQVEPPLKWRPYTFLSILLPSVTCALRFGMPTPWSSHRPL